MASAFPFVFALLHCLAEIDPKQIQDRADQEAGDPSGGNLSKAYVTERSHANSLPLARISCHRAVPGSRTGGIPDFAPVFSGFTLLHNELSVAAGL